MELLTLESGKKERTTASAHSKVNLPFIKDSSVHTLKTDMGMKKQLQMAIFTTENGRTGREMVKGGWSIQMVMCTMDSGGNTRDMGKDCTTRVKHKSRIESISKTESLYNGLRMKIRRKSIEKIAY
jgi:hypothetical protein